MYDGPQESLLLQWTSDSLSYLTISKTHFGLWTLQSSKNFQGVKKIKGSFQTFCHWLVAACCQTLLMIIHRNLLILQIGSASMGKWMTETLFDNRSFVFRSETSMQILLASELRKGVQKCLKTQFSGIL